MKEGEHRYLAISELFLPTKGGTAVWFSEVFKYLGGKGIHIVTADVPGASAVDSVHPNTIHRLNLRRVWWLRPESLGMYVRLFATSLWLCLTNRFEAIHAIRSLPEGLVAWGVARLSLKPVKRIIDIAAFIQEVLSFQLLPSEGRKEGILGEIWRYCLGGCGGFRRDLADPVAESPDSEQNLTVSHCFELFRCELYAQ